MGFKIKTMKKLILPLKTKWYKMTSSGQKKEDYREINDYWIKRLFDKESNTSLINEAIQYFKDGHSEEFVNNVCGVFFKNFDVTELTLGYPKKNDKKRRIVFSNQGISISKGKSEWGADTDKFYFVIKHGSELIANDEQGTPIIDGNRKICNCQNPNQSFFPDNKYYCLNCWGEWYN